MDFDEVREIIDDRVEWLKAECRALADGWHMTDETMAEAGFRQLRVLKAHGLKDRPAPYLIHSFRQIGWPDPFPRPLTQYSGKYQGPKLTDDDIANYKKDAKRLSKALKDQDFLFEARGVNPQKVLRERRI